MNIELEPGESIIDTWTLIYLPVQGGKYNGKLTVTNKRLLYDAKFDVSVKAVFTEAMFIKSGSEAYLEIKKSDLRGVETEKSFFSKKVILTLADGSKHAFSYGMMDIQKVAEAIASGTRFTLQ